MLSTYLTGVPSRRDGSPFMNLLMTAPLCDSRGTIRYFIGAQVDVSGLVKECSDLESLERLVAEQDQSNVRNGGGTDVGHDEETRKDEFKELSEMLNMQELDTVRRWGGRKHETTQEELTDNDSAPRSNWPQQRLLISDASPTTAKDFSGLRHSSGKLSGVYEHYLLVRPYPSLRILFASPSLRVPGILQSPFMAKIGGSSRVREELTQALADGRGVTAKVRWVTKLDVEGRNRWIHCTPLIGSNGAIGVWMVVIVDDENDGQAPGKRYRRAPPVDPRLGRSVPVRDDEASLRDFAIHHGGGASSYPSSIGGRPGTSVTNEQGSLRSGSPYTLRVD